MTRRDLCRLHLILSIEGSTPTYYLVDGLGSTTELADGSGLVTGSYTYDVFGSVRTHTGADSEWTFTGEQNDPNGLVYLRARYYDPAIGRFLSQDPFLGLVILPQTLNRYPYVMNNAVNFVDRSGMSNVAPPLTGEKPLVHRLPYGQDKCRLFGYAACPTPPHPGDPGWRPIPVSFSFGNPIGDLLGVAWDVGRAYVEWEVSWHLNVAEEVYEWATSRTPACYGFALAESVLCTDPATWELCALYLEPAAVECSLESQ